MIPFYLLAALLVALLVAVIVAGVRGATGQAPSGSGSADRQRAALNQLAELEFEYQTGKIGEDEYLAMKSLLAREALKARAELEGVEARGRGALADEDDGGSRP